MKIRPEEIAAAVKDAIAQCIGGPASSNAEVDLLMGRLDAWFKALDEPTAANVMDLCVIPLTQGIVDAGKAAAARGENATRAMEAWATAEFTDERFFRVCAPAIGARFPEVEAIRKEYQAIQQRRKS